MGMRRIRASLIALAVILVAPLYWSGQPAHAEAEGCDPGLESDFNGDSRSDTVVADPYATVEGQVQAGRVIVLYGDADGRIGEGARDTITQGADSIGGIPDANDRFGSALAAADIDCDGYTDLVVGTPYEDINGQADSGYAQIIWGSGAGLGEGTASRNLTQTNFGTPIVAGDQFGYAVDALEDVGQGGTPADDAYAVAIGAPGTNVGGDNDAGWVGFLVALDGGNVVMKADQDTPGIPGAAEPGDRFGASVSLNYLVGSAGVVDAAVGAPNEDIGSLADPGQVTILRDIYDEIDGGIVYDQNFPGVPGAAEAGDRFGRSLDTVKVGATSSRLAVGIPGEDVGSDANAGSVQLFSSNTTTVTPRASLTQDTAGVTGTAEPGDLFGDQVTFAAPGLGDTATRVAVSVPSEDGAAAHIGQVQVFPVADLGGESTYAQDSPGVPGGVDAGDHFGSTLAFVAGASERALIIGVPDDVDNSLGMVNVIPLGGGTPRAWVPGADGIPTGGISRFGGAVASVNGGST